MIKLNIIYAVLHWYVFLEHLDMACTLYANQYRSILNITYWKTNKFMKIKLY